MKGAQLCKHSVKGHAELQGRRSLNHNCQKKRSRKSNQIAIYRPKDISKNSKNGKISIFSSSINNIILAPGENSQDWPGLEHKQNLI